MCDEWGGGLEVWYQKSTFRNSRHPRRRPWDHTTHKGLSTRSEEPIHAITPLCGAGSYGGGGAEEARGLAGSGMDGLVRFGGSGGDIGGFDVGEASEGVKDRGRGGTRY